MGDWVCMDCGRRAAAAAASCTGCGSQQALLDGSKDDIRSLLCEIDDRRRDKHEARLRWAAVVLSMLVTALLVIFAHRVVLAILPLPAFVNLGITAGGLGILFYSGATRLLPARRRFAWATPRELEPPAQPAP